MTTIEISLSEAMHRWVQRRVESGLYIDVSEYIRDLIRRDRVRVAFDGRSAFGGTLAEDESDEQGRSDPTAQPMVD